MADGGASARAALDYDIVVMPQAQHLNNESEVADTDHSDKDGDHGSRLARSSDVDCEFPASWRHRWYIERRPTDKTIHYREYFRTDYNFRVDIRGGASIEGTVDCLSLHMQGSQFRQVTGIIYSCGEVNRRL